MSNREDRLKLNRQLERIQTEINLLGLMWKDYTRSREERSKIFEYSLTVIDKEKKLKKEIENEQT